MALACRGLISCWPTWTPSAPTSAASSAASLIRKGTPYLRHTARISRASRRSVSRSIPFSRSWIMVAPPARDSSTCWARVRSPSQLRSVTAYSFKCSVCNFILDPPVVSLWKRKRGPAPQWEHRPAASAGHRSPSVGITQIRSPVEAHSFLSARLRAPILFSL